MAEPTATDLIPADVFLTDDDPPQQVQVSQTIHGSQGGRYVVCLDGLAGPNAWFVSEAWFSWQHVASCRSYARFYADWPKDSHADA